VERREGARCGGAAPIGIVVGGSRVLFAIRDVDRVVRRRRVRSDRVGRRRVFSDPWLAERQPTLAPEEREAGDDTHAHESAGQHGLPQTSLPSGHLVPATVASGPHESEQFALAPHVTTQSLVHFTSHEAVSLQATVLAAPRLSLHVADWEHVAVERAPDLRSQFDEASHVMTLPSPPLPLHCAVALQSIVTVPVLSAWHFAPLSHVIEQVALPHVDLQSPPAEQVH